MANWIKNGWRMDTNPFIKTLLNREKGIAIMIFWDRIRIATLNKQNTDKFNLMMDAPNYQHMEAFLLLNGDIKIGN